MRNRVLGCCAAVVAAALMLAASAAAPAMAGAEPPVVGCTTQSSCFVEANYVVSYSGSSGGDNGVVIPPPPCIGVPYGDAHTGSQAIIALYGPSPAPTPTATPTATSSASASAGATPFVSTSPSPPPPAPALTAAEQKILDKAKTLVNSNPITPGEWYQIAGNPLATSAAQQQCSNEPPYVWIAGGAKLPIVDGATIPGETLAALAYNQLNTAPLGTVTLNPKGQSDTNLPTFVDVAINPPRLGVLSTNINGNPFVYATAATPFGNAATVWAWVTGVTINTSPAAGSGTPPTSPAISDAPDCAVAHAGSGGHGYVLGSRFSPTEMSQAGVETPIDCGVTYTSPGTYDLTVSVGWDACWTPGTAVDANLSVWPPAGCKAVPGAAGLQPTTTNPVQVSVREIRSVNNG